MTEPTRPNDRKILSEALTKRLLTRAGEIDGVLRAGASIAELRAAALEAGISAEAFDAALSEAQREESRCS